MNQLQTTILLLILLISITIIPAYGEVICHKGNTIDIDKSAVQKHLDNHGDTLGACDTDTDGTDNGTNDSKKKSGCSDCIPPIFVSIKINNDMYDELEYETPIKSFPMTKIVSLKIVVFENRIKHMDVIQVGTVPKVGDSINESVDLMSFTFGWDNKIDSIDISENIDTVFYTSKIVHCEHYHTCLELSIWYMYKVIPTGVLAFNTFDVSRNTSNVYLVLN